MIINAISVKYFTESYTWVKKKGKKGIYMTNEMYTKTIKFSGDHKFIVKLYTRK